MRRRSGILLSSLVLGCSVTTEIPYAAKQNTTDRAGADVATPRSPPPIAANPPRERSATADAPRAAALSAAVESRVATEIELVTAGGAPRSPMRRSAKPGREQRLVLVVKPHMNLKTDGVQVGDRDLPPMTLQLLARVGQVADDGTMHVAIEVTSAEFDASVGDSRSQRATERSMAMLRAMKVELDISEQGIPRNVQIAVPPRVADDLRAPVESILLLLPQLFVPIPTEPVGAGAKWTATTGIAYAGLDLKQVGEVKLVSRTAENNELEWSNEQAQDTTVSGGERPVDKVATSSTGSVTFAKDTALPTHAKARTHAELTSKVFANAVAEQALLTLDLDFELATAK